MKLSLQKIRALLYSKILTFFMGKGFTPVEVPILSQFAIPENTIDLMETEYSRLEKRKKLYLTPSPEIFLKSLLAQGWGDLFCLTKSFRNDEINEGRHNAEFTMLEYYKTAATYKESLLLTEAFFDFLIKEKKNWGVEKVSESCRPPFLQISIAEAFFHQLGIDLERSIKGKSFRKEMEEKTNRLFDGYSDEDIFQWAMVAFIEPNLPKEKGVFLIDYPSFVTTTGKSAQNPFWTQRWELYIRRLEIANCYTEKSNRFEMEAYYQNEKKGALTEQEKRYLQQFDHFPECSGTAMGVDRLLMALLELEEINNLLLFPQKDPNCV